MERFDNLKIFTCITAIFFSLIMCFNDLVWAHDKHFAVSDNMKQWFDTLRSKKGPCCSDADGSVIKDTDWDTADGHYRVFIEGKWLVVPDDAVIKEPNLYGPTMVWPIRSNGQTYGYNVNGAVVDIRCFMPGMMM